MPEIVINITQGSEKVSNNSIEIKGSTMEDLIASLRVAKEDTNAILTKLVESSSGKEKQTRKSDEKSDEDKSEDSSDNNEDDNSRKKIKT
ncbi:CLUMA_CG020687, isoform A [Clunio marinus]|uniref:CLUMA_CG020687, isoform A n=1 Tax=Clunio marinus TaxID=568069 RepID=A0A1J1J5R8_9DIPT|nr:CLUMA_CG020687, isoform A [Clunio marinus]